jgi:hypothetical protein
METKIWYKSVTVWFNVALLLVATVTQLSQIVPLSPELVAVIATVGNALLRFKTITGITIN